MKKIIFFVLIALILSACQPASEGTTSQTQVTATSTAQVESLIPPVDGALTKAEAQEWTGEDLQTRLAAFQTMPLYLFKSDAQDDPILLENIDKPTGKAAFDIRQDSFTLAFGVNGESWLTLADGERNVVMDFDNYTDPATGQKIENMYAYSIYLDPDTRQITDKIDENSLRVPVLSEIRGVNGQPSKLIYLDWHNPLMSEADFYDVVAAGKPADALLSLVSPNILQDIVSAPDFVNEINFAGDWKVVFDQDGNSIMIDVANGEELGKFENGMKWVEAMTPEKMWSEEVKEWGLNAEDYSEKKDVDGNLAVVKNSTKEVVYWVDENGVGYWNLQVMRKMIVETQVPEKMCKPTSYVGVKRLNMPPAKDPESFMKNYYLRLVEAAKKLETKNGFPFGSSAILDFLGGPNNCWAIEFAKRYAPSIDDLQPLTTIAWKVGDNGTVTLEKAFNPNLKKIELSIN